MNRLGFSNIDDFKYSYDLIKDKVNVEGIFSHIYNAVNKEDTYKQIYLFKVYSDIVDVKIRHFFASDALLLYEKPDFCNGCRLGISMYGIIDYKDIKFKPTFSLYSEVVQINDVENETVGYNGRYKVNGKEKIAVVSIGYADGIIRKNTGRYVYINGKKYQIVGNVCMDMLFVKVDDTVKVGDKVTVIKDIEHIKEIANHLDTITYEVICSISKRVPRINIK
jgi:alanine racemase